MNNNIKNPLFIIAKDDGEVFFLNDISELNTCGIEVIDVENSEYKAFGLDGQIFELFTVRRTYNGMMSFIFNICSILFDYKDIKAIPQEIKNPNELMKDLSRYLSFLGHNIEGLTLNELIYLYKIHYIKI